MIDISASKRQPHWRLAALFLCAFALATNPLAAADGKVALGSAGGNVSLQNEVQHAIDRGLAYLSASQHTNGWWSTPDHPAVTALALTAFNGDPLNRHRGRESETLKKGYQFILKFARPDGAICGTNLVTYNTSVSMMGLLSARNPEFEPLLAKARAFLVGIQTDLDEPGKADNSYDGGFGYGMPNNNRSDLANTLSALEAVHFSKPAPDQARVGEKDLNWKAAIEFLQKCQNLPAYNKESWASDDATNKGGFVYLPGRSMAGGETNNATGKVALRSYGSMSYAGLLSYIYADLKTDDARVQAVREWLRVNYSVTENPGLGSQGLYYYYHVMAKALSLSGTHELEVNGKRVDWRSELALKLMQSQRPDGSWVNENVRWWEKESDLVTAYALLSLELLWRNLGA